MGHRRTDLTTIRYSRFGAWESQWASRTNYNSILFQDFQINRYILGIFYKLRYPTSAIKIKRFSMNLVIISTTVYVPMSTNIGLLFFNSDFMAAIVVYMYRLLKLNTYVNRASRTAGIVVGSAREKQLAYLYNTGLASSLSFKYRMQLFFRQYIKGLHANDQVYISALLATIRKDAAVISNTVFLAKILQYIMHRASVYVLHSPTQEVYLHAQLDQAIAQRIVQYNNQYVDYCAARMIEHETDVADRTLVDLRAVAPARRDLRAVVRARRDLRAVAPARRDLRAVARTRRRKYKSGINTFIGTANKTLHQSVFSRLEPLFDEIKASYSRLSFLYNRYIGLIDRSENTMFALAQIRIALSRLERLLRHLRAHIKRSHMQDVISRARMYATYGALDTFTRIAQHIRVGQLYPDLMADAASVVQVEDEKLTALEKKAYFSLVRAHAKTVARSRRVVEKTDVGVLSYEETTLCKKATALCRFVICTNGMYTCFPYLATYSAISRTTRSKRLLKRMARPKELVIRVVRYLSSKGVRHNINPEAVSLLSVLPVSKKKIGVVLAAYKKYIERKAHHMPKAVFRYLRNAGERSFYKLEAMKKKLSGAVHTLNGVGLFRVKHILLGIRKQYKSLLWYEERVMRLRIRAKQILLNAISEYGLVHPPLVHTILVKRNILMVLAGQLMRLTANMDIRMLDNIVASASRKSTISARIKQRKRNSNRWHRRVRNKRGVSRGIGILSNILIALQQTASRAVSVRTMYSGLSRLQNFVAVLKRRLRRSIKYYTNIASEYVKKMGLHKIEITRALAQVKKENQISSLLGQDGMVHSIIRAYTNYSFYTRLVELQLTKLTDARSKSIYYNIRRPGTIHTTIYKPVFNLLNTNTQSILSAITNVSTDLIYVCSRLAALQTYAARIIYRALLSRISRNMHVDIYVELLRQLSTMNSRFVKYSFKVKHVQEYIYITKVRMRYATILGQNGLNAYITRLGNIFRSKQKMLYSGERWLFVKLGRVTQVMMHKWFIDTLTVFNLYMEDTLSRFLNMRVLLILNFFRERHKRWNPRIFIDNIGTSTRNLEHKQLPSKWKRKFPPMDSAKLLCEYVRNRIERGAYMNRVFRDVRYWQKLELRKLNRLQHRAPKVYYRIEKKYPLDGIRILISGPRKKARRKKRVYYHIWLRKHDYSRRMPLQTVNKHIEFHKLHARRRASAVGVKVWLAFRTISQNEKNIGT